ncbi:MAG: hypothetical protein J0M12_13020 [Deltaproteobacteria bacterium]|nr:hypothetical protein [Deltaproteobacteria bacterium]
MTPPRRLAPRLTADTAPGVDESLGSTAETFAGRMQRRLKEQELKDLESRKSVQARHTLMLQAMTTIRKALVGTSRINLGERFSFDLEVNDWEGWPRVELNLVDACAPTRIEHALIITANDRKNLGTVQISTKSGETLARLHLEQQSEMEKLPLVLKKAVRHFLDLISGYILNPPSAQELLEEQSKSLGSTDFDCLDKELGEADLFHEDAPIGDRNTVDNLEDLAPLESLGSPLK